MDAEFVDIPHEGRRIRIEYAWIAARDERAPLLVFLHEGLGSLAMWKDWPAQLCAAGGYRGLVYSRYGYGRSTPRPAEERWPPDSMHVHASDMLGRMFDALRLRIGGDRKPWLLGHSDGATIALIQAAAHPDALAGVIAIAPHIMVEDVAIASIERARDAYRTSDLRERLARYHVDPDSAFWGWNDLWLDPQFRDWSIEDMLARIRCPVLAVQGREDEYGTLAQVERVRARVPGSEVVVLDDCGHSPHRDQPAALTRAVTDFISRHAVAVDNAGGLQ
jgi:pimeloyl-ACP methyl ester carboxylesterase